MAVAGEVVAHLRIEANGPHLLDQPGPHGVIGLAVDRVGTLIAQYGG
jgi:hypothetical protein